MANNKKRQFCKKGHDKHVTGTLDGGRCKVCRNESNRSKPPRILTSEQKEAKAENLKAWRKANPEKNREYDRKYYAENPEARKTKSANYREAHKKDPKKPATPERVAYLKQYHQDNTEREKLYRASRKEIQDAYNREYYKQYNEEIKEHSSLYYQNNKEQCAANSLDRRKKNPEKFKNQARAAKYNRRMALGSLTAAVVEQVWECGDGICAYCLKVIEGAWHLEHCTPLSRGGTNFPDNLVVSCDKCNNPKYTKTALEHFKLWKKVTPRYDFFNEEFLVNVLKLSEKELVKLDKLHEKHYASDLLEAARKSRNRN